MIFLKINTEIRKVDSQGRIVLPLKWREKELKNEDEVIIEIYRNLNEYAEQLSEIGELDAQKGA